MRDVHAVAAVTATLAGIIQRAVASRGADVTTSRPDRGAGAKPRVNVFLYHVVPNRSLRNLDLPTRRADGSLIQDPQLALDLFYILSIYGPDDLPTLTNQVLLGLTLDALHVKPIFDTRDVVDAIAGNPAFDDVPELVDAGRRVQQVVLGMVPMEVDQLSRLWSMAFQAPYVLSVAYKASVALLTAGLTPQPALPVLERRFHVFQLTGPWLETAGPAGGDLEPLVVTSTLVVTGRGLDQPGLRLWLGSSDLPVSEAEEIDGSRVAVPLETTGSTLRAGVLPVRATLPSGSLSNTLAVVLRPILSAVSVTSAGSEPRTETGERRRPAEAGDGTVHDGTVHDGTVHDGTVHVTTWPPVERGQRLALLLDETPPPAVRSGRAYRFESVQSTTDDAVDLPFRGVAAGTYTVRLGVDDADSVPAAGASGDLDVPSITVPPAASPEPEKGASAEATP